MGTARERSCREHRDGNDTVWSHGCGVYSLRVGVMCSCCALGLVRKRFGCRKSDRVKGQSECVVDKQCRCREVMRPIKIGTEIGEYGSSRGGPGVSE
jgi:hypothetical protein